MKSRKQLFKDMIEIVTSGKAMGEVPAKPQDFHNETYGRDSMIYISWVTPADRQRGEQELRIRGHKITRYDAPDISQIQVNYFKGWHWDE